VAHLIAGHKRQSFLLRQHLQLPELQRALLRPTASVRRDADVIWPYQSKDQPGQVQLSKAFRDTSTEMRNITGKAR
jgi:hypothetical protein